jgi:hypothetical protein
MSIQQQHLHTRHLGDHLGHIGLHRLEHVHAVCLIACDRPGSGRIGRRKLGTPSKGVVYSNNMNSQVDEV